MFLCLPVTLGLSRVNSYGYGDHYLHVKVHVPSKLTKVQQSLIEAYAQTEMDRVGTVNLTSAAPENSTDNAKTDAGTNDDESIMNMIKKKLF